MILVFLLKEQQQKQQQQKSFDTYTATFRKAIERIKNMDFMMSSRCRCVVERVKERENFCE